MNDELERLQKKVVMAYMKILSSHVWKTENFNQDSKYPG